MSTAVKLVLMTQIKCRSALCNENSGTESPVSLPPVVNVGKRTCGSFSRGGFFFFCFPQFYTLLHNVTYLCYDSTVAKLAFILETKFPLPPTKDDHETFFILIVTQQSNLFRSNLFHEC